MFKKTAIRTGSATAILMLGACTWFQQPAAPVVSGTAATGSYAPPVEAGSVGTAASNPYGATPYNPNANGASVVNNAPSYAPPVAQPYTPPAASGGSYVPSYAPVDINAATHTVVRGDTVYNISKRYNISQDNLRAWNNMPDNTLSVGQVVRVKPAGYTAPAVTSSQPMPTPVPGPVKQATASAQAAVPAPASVAGSGRAVSGITWQRPALGSVIANFGGSSKGVDIAGKAGQPIAAAADGKVVYAGSGLRGYGNLVIIQHNATFLTAYGHNQSLLVSEGQSVKRGQTIATMGSSDADRTKLHFEVRENGKPVNPTTYVAF